MLQNLPFVLSVAMLSFLFVMWIYPRTFSGVQRIFFFVIGTIGLTALYAILAAGYFGITYTQEGWELWAVIGAVISLLIIGSLTVSKVGMLAMVLRIRSGKIGKTLIESKKITKKVEKLKETLWKEQRVIGSTKICRQAGTPHSGRRRRHTLWIT